MSKITSKVASTLKRAGSACWRFVWEGFQLQGAMLMGGDTYANLLVTLHEEKAHKVSPPEHPTPPDAGAYGDEPSGPVPMRSYDPALMAAHERIVRAQGEGITNMQWQDQINAAALSHKEWLAMRDYNMPMDYPTNGDQAVASELRADSYRDSHKHG